MMKSMKYVPGGLDTMEKMMPAMFPMMAPGILGLGITRQSSRA